MIFQKKTLPDDNSETRSCHTDTAISHVTTIFSDIGYHFRLSIGIPDWLDVIGFEDDDAPRKLPRMVGVSVWF